MEKLTIVRQLFAGLAVSMPLASAGFHFGWSAPSLPKLLAEDSDIPITSGESAWIVTFISFGSLFGPFVCSPLVDRYGRKLSILLTAVPFLSSCILIGLAQSYWWFIVARFLAGIGLGMSHVVAPMYLGEIADDRIRGALATMITLMMSVGILLSYCVGPWISRAALAAIGGSLPLIFGLLIVWVPESPYFLIMKNEPDRAEKSLSWFSGNENVSEVLKNLQEHVELDRKNVGGIKELIMIPGNRKALIIVVGLAMAQQFSGISAILAYSSLIFEASGSTLDSNTSVIIIGVIQLLSGVLTIFTVDLAGRRPLLLFSASSSVLFLGGEALYFQLRTNGDDVSALSWLPITAIIGYIICYSVGLGSLYHVVISEIFPYEVKAVANLVTVVIVSLSGIAVGKLYQVVADEFGIHVSFWGFAVITIFSSLFIYFMLPETKQRSLQDIQDELRRTTVSKTELSRSEVA